MKTALVAGSYVVGAVFAGALVTIARGFPSLAHLAPVTLSSLLLPAWISVFACLSPACLRRAENGGLCARCAEAERAVEALARSAGAAP